MKKYEYDNAIVYITRPSEESIDNIRKATERFVKSLVREGIDIYGWSVESNKRAGRTNGSKRR